MDENGRFSRGERAAFFARYSGACTDWLSDGEHRGEKIGLIVDCAEDMGFESHEIVHMCGLDGCAQPKEQEDN